MCYLIGLAVSGASVLCFTWATMLRQCCREGASCGWRRSRKGVPTGSARTPRGTLRDVRAPAVWRNFRAHTCVWYQVFAQRCSPTYWANTRNGSPRNPGILFVAGDAHRSMVRPTRCRSAPFVVLRVVPWRRILSYASLPCRRNGLRAWRPERLLRGDVWLSSSSCFCDVLSHRPGRSWCV